jgi:hypothetical protein
MSNKTAFILIILVLVLAWVLLKPGPRQSGAGRIKVAVSAAGGGAGVARNRSSLPAGSTTTTKSSTNSELTSQRTVVAGGAVAGKTSGSSVKPISTPGVPQAVLEAAKTGLPFFLGQIPPGSKELYGFASTDDLSAARLGAPLQMLTIRPAAIDKSSSSATVSSILSETSMWYFPIRIESESKAMLVVDRDGGTWKAVSFGYTSLGHELNELLAQWPDSKGFHPQLIAVFPAKRFYFTVPEVGDFNLTQIRLAQEGFSRPAPAAIAAEAQPQDYGTLSEVSKSLDELRPIVLRAEMHAAR